MQSTEVVDLKISDPDAEQMEFNEADTMEELNSHNGVTYHWQLWEFMGLMQPANTVSALFLLRSVLINALSAFVFPLSLVINLFFTQNLQELCENLTITVTDSFASVKYFNVYLIRRHLYKIRKLLVKMDRRVNIVNNKEELAELHKYIQISRYSFGLFLITFEVGVMLSCVRVIFASERQLLFPAWFGINWKNSNWNYVIILIYQITAIGVQAVQESANDSYPTAYLSILTGHMRALELRVRRIGYPALNPELPEEEHKRHRALAYKDLRDCIEDYIDILRLHAIIQKILSVPCLAQFASSAVVQCTGALHFIYVAGANDLSSMLLLLLMVFAVTLEVLIISFFADRMHNQSEMLLNAFYDCNWMDQSPTFKSNLIFTLIRTQRPSLISAGGYMTVNLGAFVQVIKFTYSVFTVLMQSK